MRCSLLSLYESDMAGLLLNSARTVGLAAACVVMILYGVALVGEPTPAIAAMMVLALVASWASLLVRPFVLCAVFFFSFFPFGLYLMFVPGYLRWIALCDVLYLVAAGLMLVARGYQGSDSSRT